MQFITILFECIYKLVTEYIVAVFIMHYITKDIKPVHRLKTIIVLRDSQICSFRSGAYVYRLINVL